MTITNKEAKCDQDQYTYENDAEARRAILVSTDGTNISSTNPLHITGSVGVIATATVNIEGDYADDSAFTAGTDIGLMVGGFFTTDEVNSGDFGAFKMNAKRELFVAQDTAASLNVTEANSANISTNIENLTRTEDTAHATGDRGIMALGVRNDDLGTTFVSGDGDYTPIATCEKGAIFVNGGKITRTAAGMSCGAFNIAGITYDSRPTSHEFANDTHWSNMSVTEYAELRVRDDDANDYLDSISTSVANITNCDTANVTISAAIPAGSNYIGSVTFIGSILGALPAGTNTMGVVSIDGDVDVNVTNSSLNVNVTNSSLDVNVTSSIVAGTNTIGTSIITTGKTLKSTAGTAGVNGDNEIIPASTGVQLHVYAYSIMMTGKTEVKPIWESSTNGADIWGGQLFDNAATGQVAGSNLAVSPPASIFHTDTGESLNLRLDAAVTCSYAVAYWEETV